VPQPAKGAADAARLQDAAELEKQLPAKPATPHARAAVATAASDTRGEPVAPSALAAARRLLAEQPHALLAKVLDGPRAPELQQLNNALMDHYRVFSSVPAFTLLFELNTRPFSLIAARIMRMTSSRADLGDILQETFLAIYRYPSRFCPDQPNAFRNWSYSIIRNTVYRHLHADGREGIPVDLFADLLPDERARSPVTESEDAESDVTCQRVYLLLLALYVEIHDHHLKPRDRQALQLVEVQRLPYADAARLMGVRLENFKMIVCRARKKIFQSLVRTLGSQQS
jgi:RNA polymerase sigma factor (sigma-70 family)